MKQGRVYDIRNYFDLGLLQMPEPIKPEQLLTLEEYYRLKARQAAEAEMRELIFGQ